jgi:outer membrane protein assembly factor BamB
MNLRHIVIVTASLLMLACSSQEIKTDIEEPKEIGPAPLSDIDASVEVDVVWRRNLGLGVGARNIRLKPAVSGDVVFMADYNGELSALELASGDEIWSVSFDHKISGGVVESGSDVYIATQDGVLHSVAKNSGEITWSQPLSSESIAPVVADAQQVYIRTIDGHMTAFDRKTGKQNWTYEAVLPVLTVHGTAAPVLMHNLVISGFANGKLIALDRELGIPRWNKRLAIPDITKLCINTGAAVP